MFAVGSYTQKRVMGEGGMALATAYAGKQHWLFNQSTICAICWRWASKKLIPSRILQNPVSWVWTFHWAHIASMLLWGWPCCHHDPFTPVYLATCQFKSAEASELLSLSQLCQSCSKTFTFCYENLFHDFHRTSPYNDRLVVGEKSPEASYSWVFC